MGWQNGIVMFCSNECIYYALGFYWQMLEVWIIILCFLFSLKQINCNVSYNVFKKDVNICLGLHITSCLLSLLFVNVYRHMFGRVNYLEFLVN